MEPLHISVNLLLLNRFGLIQKLPRSVIRCSWMGRSGLGFEVQREKERERESGGETEREKESESETAGEREGEKERNKGRDRRRETETRGRWRERQRDKERGREREREREGAGKRRVSISHFLGCRQLRHVRRRGDPCLSFCVTTRWSTTLYQWRTPI